MALQAVIARNPSDPPCSSAEVNREAVPFQREVLVEPVPRVRDEARERAPAPGIPSRAAVIVANVR